MTTEASHRFYESFHRVMAASGEKKDGGDLVASVVEEWIEMGLVPRLCDTQMNQALGSAFTKIDAILEKIN